MRAPLLLPGPTVFCDILSMYDGTEYWGEWQCGLWHGWGIWRTIDGESEYRGQWGGGQHSGLGMLRERGLVKVGRWVDGALVVQQRFPVSALFAARDAAIRAGVGSICARIAIRAINTECLIQAPQPPAASQTKLRPLQSP